jgi:hypothetical protein
MQSSVTDEFKSQVNEFIQKYHPALDALAKE